MSNKELLTQILQKLGVLDNRLSNLELKVSSLDSKVTSLDNRLSNLELKVSSLDSKVTSLDSKLEQYIKREADISEQEITQALYKYLIKKEQQQTIFILNNFLQKIINPLTGKVLTDLDGVIISTNNKKIIKKFKVKDTLSNNLSNRFNINLYGTIKEYKKIVNENTSLKNKSKIFIIEAKRHMTTQKINKKIEQYQFLKDLLKLVHKPNLNMNSIKLRKFQGTIQHFLLDEFIPDNIYLVLGACIWDNNCKNIIPKDKNIKTISLSGNRYQINENNSSLDFPNIIL